MNDLDRDRIKRILVIKLRHIGDVLLTSPVFEHLARAFPDARIWALVNSGTEEMLTGNPFIEEVLVFERSIKSLPLPKRLAEESAFLRKIRSFGFDLSIDLTGGDRAALVSFVSGARVRIGVDPKGKGFPGKKRLYTATKMIDYQSHTVLQNLSLLEPLGISPGAINVDLSIPDEARNRVRTLLEPLTSRAEGPLIHIHPTSRWFFKCWPPEQMGMVIRWLTEQGNSVVITASPEARELRMVDEIMMEAAGKSSSSHPRIINLAGQLTLKELGAVSEQADLFFGIDSAPMHMAAAVNTPVVALFGPTRAFNWGPWPNGIERQGKAQPYRSSKGLQEAGLHTVLQLDWDCIPCDQDGCNGTKESKCLEAITPETVTGIIDKILRNLNG